MNTLKLIAKTIFLIFTICLIIAYSISLVTKIEQPHFKNLNTKELILLGILLLGFIFINFKLFSPYFKNKK
ncbi:hypothetical protein C8P67_102124 [Flavobacterium aquicola]|uniref:Uncharacterized protein n=1 Tax=Flavobacterium aquicola TaxID=1682742 RepID=A0A3E0ERM4_9FLAO|nr:hypothetical protein C8P67_102124 [Flavobacterium aquicola]